MNGAEISSALREGRRVFGTLVVSTSPHWPAAVSGIGLDFVFLDTEHIAIGREQLSRMCRLYAALGLAPIVRIPDPDPYRACMVLDGGASGVIAPYVETVEQVKALRGAVKLRPLKGARLQRILDGVEEPEPALADYLERRNRGNVLVINIESRPAMDRLEELLAVPGVDAVLIGPHDLSINLGIPEQYLDPRFDAAVRQIIRMARDRHIGAGIHFSSGIDQEIAWMAAGANLVVHSSDIMAASQALAAEFRALRSSTGETGHHLGSAGAHV